MSLTLYAHPFSSYSQKVLIALYESQLAFDYRMLESPGAMDELKARWPFARFPLLVDGAVTVVESSIIIEHLTLHHGGEARLIPADPAAAIEVRFLDRFFDLYVMTPMQKPVFEVIRNAGAQKEQKMAEAVAELTTAYGWLERQLQGRTWAAGEQFTMADCSAAPSLFYADWVHPIAGEFPWLRAYRTRLLQRPSFARAVEEARPFRSYFPLGAPQRD